MAASTPISGAITALETPLDSQEKVQRQVAITCVDSIFEGFTTAMNFRGIPANFAPKTYAKITPDGRKTIRAILEELAIPLD